MFKKVLVPLDGSKLAECVLPYIEGMAKVIDEVVLVSVTERIQGFRAVEDYGSPTEERMAQEAVGKMERQATKYLDRIGKGLEEKGIKVTRDVLLGNPAEEIIIYAETKKCDLILMASHGRGGISRWVHGSVTDRVSSAVCIPMMIIRAPGCAAKS
jgi:nucleotide-binding universal stress UspA family protein